MTIKTRAERESIFESTPYQLIEAPVCWTRRILRPMSVFFFHVIQNDPDYWYSSQEEPLRQFRANLFSAGYTEKSMGVDSSDPESIYFMPICIFEVAVIGDDFYRRKII